jgi:thiol:disulfide interchange protein
MLVLKQAFAFPMFATAIWLVWVASVQSGPRGRAGRAGRGAGGGLRRLAASA